MGGPPLCCGTLQKVCREGDIIGGGDISRFHLMEDVTQPVVGIQRIDCVAEERWVESHKLWQCDGRWRLVGIGTGKLIDHPLYKLAVHFELLHHSCHIVRRWWIIVSHPAQF